MLFQLLLSIIFVNGSQKVLSYYPRIEPLRFKVPAHRSTNPWNFSQFGDGAQKKCTQARVEILRQRLLRLSTRKVDG